jgi:hypothetical protein
MIPSQNITPKTTHKVLSDIKPGDQMLGRCRVYYDDEWNVIDPYADPDFDDCSEEAEGMNSLLQPYVVEIAEVLSDRVVTTEGVEYFTGRFKDTYEILDVPSIHPDDYRKLLWM